MGAWDFVNTRAAASMTTTLATTSGQCLRSVLRNATTPLAASSMIVLCVAAFFVVWEAMESLKYLRARGRGVTRRGERGEVFAREALRPPFGAWAPRPV